MNIDIHRASILVIDDETPIVNLLTSFLTDIGFDVTGYTDPQEAKNSIEDSEYDLIITDLVMPGITGLDIVKLIQDMKRDTKVVILTGHASIDSAISAIQYGVYDYIRKPFKLDEIEVLLDRALTQLFLQRENVKLNKQVEKMLADITMLSDISQIMYQIPDADMCADMILDTLTEGMKLKHVALLEKSNSNKSYIVQTYKGLDKTLADSLEIGTSVTINGISLQQNKVLQFIVENGAITIDNQIYQLGRQYQIGVIVPVMYQEMVMAYLFVLKENSNISDDEIKLLTVLSTQVAPIFYSNSTSIDNHVNGTENISINSYPIEYAVAEAKKIESIVSFSLGRVRNMDGKFLNGSISSLKNNVAKAITESVSDKTDFKWLSMDTFLITFQNKNKFSAEMSGINIRDSFEKIYMDGTAKLNMTMDISSISYPSEIKDASQVMDKLENNLLKIINDVFETVE